MRRRKQMLRSKQTILMKTVVRCTVRDARFFPPLSFILQRFARMHFNANWKYYFFFAFKAKWSIKGSIGTIVDEFLRKFTFSNNNSVLIANDRFPCGRSDVTIMTQAHEMLFWLNKKKNKKNTRKKRIAIKSTIYKLAAQEIHSGKYQIYHMICHLLIKIVVVNGSMRERLHNSKIRYDAAIVDCRVVRALIHVAVVVSVAVSVSI